MDSTVGTSPEVRALFPRHVKVYKECSISPTWRAWENKYILTVHYLMITEGCQQLFLQRTYSPNTGLWYIFWKVSNQFRQMVTKTTWVRGQWFHDSLTSNYLFHEITPDTLRCDGITQIQTFRERVTGIFLELGALTSKSEFENFPWLN